MDMGRSSTGVGLFFYASPTRLYGSDMVCKNEDALSKVAKLYDRNVKSTYFRQMYFSLSLRGLCICNVLSSLFPNIGRLLTKLAGFR